jgi:hypothetical protein
VRLNHLVIEYTHFKLAELYSSVIVLIPLIAPKHK